MKSLVFMCIVMCSFGFIILNSKGSIKGEVVDKSNEEPVPFAKVTLENKSNGKKWATETDFDGKYDFDVAAGIYDLTISSAEYSPLKIKDVKVNSEKTTFLKNKLEFLAPKEIEEVEVIAYEAPLINRDGGASSRTLSSQDIAKSPIRSRGARPDFNQQDQEGYVAIEENGFKDVKASPLSTFSIDVDAASYTNVRRFLKQGNLPPKDAVRIEEFINYFNYDYPDPVGEHPFSITTEFSDNPWNSKNKLVHIGLQGERIKTDDLAPSNLVFLIDVSGSMYQFNRLPLVKKSLKMLVNNLNPDDKVSIVVYAGAAGEVLPATSAKEKATILEAINQLEAGGSTAGGAGIKLAYKVASENFIKNGNNRVIICTDGDFNVGQSSDAEMHRLIEKQRETGVFLTCLGYGMGNYKDSKLETLADRGNGNYAYIDDLMEAKKVLVNEMGSTLHTIAKDVKLQLEFNPNIVHSYRLVGYENRLLNDEDFNDDTKDAGELGAGHSVTALYEVEFVDGNKNADKVDELKYQERKNTDNKEEVLTVKFRYKDPDKDKSKLLSHIVKMGDYNTKPSNDFNWSSAVAMYAMNLRESEFLLDGNLETIKSLAKNSIGTDERGYRSNFIQMIDLTQSIKDQASR